MSDDLDDDPGLEDLDEDAAREAADRLEEIALAEAALEDRRAAYFAKLDPGVAERSLVACVIQTPAALERAVSAGVDRASFETLRFGRYFGAVEDLYGDGIGLITSKLLLERLELARAVDRDTLAEVEALCAVGEPLDNAGYFAARVAGDALRRHRRRLALQVARQLEEGDDAGAITLIAELAASTSSASAGEGDAAGVLDWPATFKRSLEADWLVEPLIAAGRGHALYAGQKSGKSLLIGYVAVTAALGLAVLDRPAGDPLRTLYLDYEMTRDDVADRVESMGYGLDEARAGLLEPLRYVLNPSIPPLDTPAGGLTVRGWARSHRADLVVVDTMARAVEGNENDADTYRAFYRHTGAGLKADGVALFRMDHAGKDADRGQRGSSAKADDVDVVYRLEPRERGALTLRCTHQRPGWIPAATELAQITDPVLRYTQVTATYPAGTKETADLLDGLGAPLNISSRAARDLLREHDRTAANDALRAAIRYRRNGDG